MNLLSSRNIFTFGSFAHTFLVLTYIVTKIDLQDFILGHMFVTLAFSEKSKLEKIPTMKTTILGIIGHFSLFFVFYNQVWKKNPYKLKSIMY